MANPMTQPFEPYEAGQGYEDDYDWDQQPEPSPDRLNILWGRVGLLAAMLLVAFLLGRVTKSSGVSEASLTRAQDKAAQLESDNEDLQSQLADKDAQIATLQTEAAADTTTEDTATEDTAAADESQDTASEPTGQTYTIKSGDTLRGIAERFYGDVSLADYLAEVNDISDPTAINVGQEILIPDNPPGQ